MWNYSQIEQLEAMNKAAESGGSAWDMVWAWVGMAMWMNMANNMWNNMSSNNNQPIKETAEDKLIKLKWLFDKWLIDEDEYKSKKSDILSNM
jgi:membrane protease subunit (stomatin/prohibitin family)